MKNYNTLPYLFLILLHITSLHGMQEDLNRTGSFKKQIEANYANYYAAVERLENTSPLYRQYKNELEQENKQYNVSERAKQHNANHPFLVKELIEKVFLVVPEKDFTGMSADEFEKKAYQHIRKLVSLHETCQFLNQYVSFSKIIEFCATLNYTVKENILQKVLGKLYAFREYLDVSHNANCISSALIQSGAGKTTAYKNKPLCFYAKSINMAQKCIDSGHNIHTTTQSNVTILTHILAKQYPANLIEFYMNNNVKLPDSILDKLVHQFNDHSTSDALRHEYLEKCRVILVVASDDIKNYCNYFRSTPLDCVCALPIKNDYVYKRFKEIVTDIFVRNGCKITKKYRNFITNPININLSDIQETLAAHDNITFKQNDKFLLYEELVCDDSIYKELLLDQKVIEDSLKLLDETPEYDSILDAVRNNDVEKVRALFTKGHIKIDERDKAGHTPLMLAVMQRNRDIVRILLNYGANCDLESYIGRTALGIAMENVEENDDNEGDNEIADWIITAASAGQID